MTEPHQVRNGTLSPLSERASYAAIVALLLFAIVLLYGQRVPFDSEQLYLLIPYKLFHPDFLRNDWTLSGGWGEHFVFNVAAGSLMLVLPLEVVGWLGRLACWILALVALLRLGRRFGIPLLATSLAVLLWLAVGQSIVGGSRIFSDFEAQAVAYVLLLFAVDRLLDDKDVQGAVLLGLCFSLHPSVGLAGGVAVGAGLLLRRTSWARLLRIAIWTFVFALPGIIPALPLVAGSAAGSRAEWRFLTLVRMPWHLDAASFPHRSVLLLYLLLLFGWLQYRKNREDRALRFLLGFEAGLAAVFAVGLLVRYAGRYEWLEVFPFRVFPILAPLLFLFQVVRAFRDREQHRIQAWAAALALVAVMGLGDPIAGFWDQFSAFRAASHKEDYARPALRWIADHTPEGSVAILPPQVRESFYWARRPQIANWGAIRYDRVSEWRTRLEAMVGPLSDTDPQQATDEALEKRFAQLSEQQVQAIAARYGGDYLVSMARYSYPVLFDSGTYRVYSLATVKARVK